METNGPRTEDLCLACGLCCNGVIFADLRLQAGDDPERLRQLGAKLQGIAPASAGAKTKRARRGAPLGRLLQPCAFFDGCRCRIYAERPQYCRAFECALFRRVRLNKLSPGTALKTINEARGRVEKVRRLLEQLGDTDEHLPLATRFRRTAGRLEEIGMDKSTADVYGCLTLAMHDLNFMLSEEFYPGP